MSKQFQSGSSETGAWLSLTGETPEQPVEECYTLLRQALHDLQQTQERLKETQHREQLKRQITSQIRTSLDLNAILQGAVSTTRELLQVESCHFSWYRPHADQPGWETITEARLPHVPSRLGWYAEKDVELLTAPILNQQCLRVSDVETLEQPELQRVFRSLGIKSHLALPIRTHSGAVGTLNCNSFSELRLWSDEDVEWLQDILDQLAIAIQQTELAAELRTSKIRLEAFFAGTNAGLVIFDRQLRFAHINEALAETNGIPAANHIGRPIGAVLPELASVLEPMFQGILDTGKPILDYELVGETPKQPGVMRYWLASYYPLLDESGTIFGVGGVVIEISDRKQAEKALRQSEERLQAILDNSPAVVYLKDLQGRFLLVNRQFENLFRISKADIVGKSNYDIFPHDLADKFQVNDQKVLDARGAIQSEEQAPHEDGLHTYLSLKFPLLDVDGVPYATCGFSTDITERKQAETALQEQTNLLQLILHSISDGIIVADEQGQFLIFNSAAEQMFGSPTDAEAKEWSQHYGLFLPDQVTPFPADELPLIRAVRGEEIKDAEFFVRHAQAPDGLWMLASAKPLRDESGQSQGGVVVCRDVTDRRQAEKTNRQTLEMLDLASDSIIIRDMSDRITYWNQGAEELYGWTKAEVVGEYIHTFLQTTFPKPLEEVLAEFFERGSWEGELHHTTRDDRHIIVASRWTLQRDASGQPCAQLEINTDITERKQAEAALAQAKEAAEAANRAKSEFLANMSHELRTPLNGVIGYAQILQRANTLNQEDRSRIEVIHQCGSHLLTLINDILDLSKIEARKVALNPSDFHLPAFLQGVAEMCRIRAELKGIQFRYQAATELPIGIRADEKRLRQVLINLLSNAIKFTDAGSVTFTTSFAREGKIRFEVRDTGIGIQQEKLQAIFQPFEQVSDAQRQSEGTGLGLAISQELVELMGSTIQVQSEIGIGSIFWFEVNLPEAAEWVKTAQANQHGQIIGIKGCRPKILVVDDRWENRSVVSKLLSPIGFDLAEAASGQAGWHKAVEFQPDLVITDLMMPDVDGFELISRLRESESFKDLVIIVSSASVFEADQYRSIEAGGNDFLPKPVLAAALLQKLQQHLHLEWLYEAQQPAIKAVVDYTELIAPPPAELETLYELAMKGNFKGILKQVALLEQIDEKYSPFAQQLHQLAKGFQDQEILALIQSYR